MSKLVTVVITTYNRPELFKRALNSFINQTYRNIEVIVIDDNSSITLQDYINTIREKNNIDIIYHRNDENMGANYCRNKALELAKGYYITGLDDDDYFLENRIQFFIDKMKSEYSFICDNYLIKNGRSYHKRFNGEELITLNNIVLDNIAGNQVFVEKQKIIKAGRYDENFSRLQDHDAWTRLIINYGNAYRFNGCTYIMDTTHEHARITTTIKDYTAYRKYYYKFRNYMPIFQMKKNLIRLCYLRGIPTSKLIKYIFKLKIPYNFSIPIIIKKIMPWSIIIKRKLIDTKIKK